MVGQPKKRINRALALTWIIVYYYNDMHLSNPIIIPYTDGEEQAGFETCLGNPRTESKGLHAWKNRAKEQNDLGANRH